MKRRALLRKDTCELVHLILKAIEEVWKRMKARKDGVCVRMGDRG